MVLLHPSQQPSEPRPRVNRLGGHMAIDGYDHRNMARRQYYLIPWRNELKSFCESHRPPFLSRQYFADLRHRGVVSAALRLSICLVPGCAVEPCCRAISFPSSFCDVYWAHSSDHFSSVQWISMSMRSGSSMAILTVSAARAKHSTPESP